MFSEIQLVSFPWMSFSHFVALVNFSKVLVYNFLNDGVTMTKWAGSNLYPDMGFHFWQDLLSFIFKNLLWTLKTQPQLGYFQSDIELSYNSHFALLNKVDSVPIGKKFKPIYQS